MQCFEQLRDDQRGTRNAATATIAIAMLNMVALIALSSFHCMSQIQQYASGCSRYMHI